ncbi:MAG TPA: hypothetical protein VFD80_08780 [Flavobacteriaceae bacterium]|nr:hypothetical protein [Flavobacteriaceae bacterium]
MNKITRQIRCSECGHININKDYCEKCGAMVNPELKREKDVKSRIKAQEEIDSQRALEKSQSFFERNRRHKNFFIRIFFQFLYSIWMAVMAIGAFIAWLAATIAAA